MKKVLITNFEIKNLQPIFVHGLFKHRFHRGDDEDLTAHYGVLDEMYCRLKRDVCGVIPRTGTGPSSISSQQVVKGIWIFVICCSALTTPVVDSQVIEGKWHLNEFTTIIINRAFQRKRLIE